MNHQLTDDHCDALWDEAMIEAEPPATMIEVSRISCRAAADWQLEQDAKLFAEYLGSLEPRSAVSPRIADLRAEWFKEAMRPQEDN